MNLSDPQIRALSELCPQSYPVPEAAAWRSSGWRWMRPNTLESLVKLGLVERRRRYPSLDSEYRITDEGITLCNSMGD